VRISLLGVERADARSQDADLVKQEKSIFMVLRAKLLVLALLLLASAIAFGQATSGDIIGTVLDKSGAVVAGATVTAVNQGTGVKSTTSTSSTGEYRFGNLPIGKYTITASAQGFASSTIKDVVLSLNATLPVRFALSVASVSTEVEVTEAAAAIDTSTAQLQSSYDSKLVQDLPTASVGSGVLNLALLQAGVATANGMGAGTGPSVGGQRPRNNNFTIEGVDNNDKGVTGPLLTVPNDAVAEFTMQQNQFSPEFGHSTGGQFNQAVQNGTNVFHGRAYEYFQNRNLNAVDTISHGVKARYDDNRFGGQVGGPILKNKLFFFTNYEYQPIGSVGTPGAVSAPTVAGYDTLLAMSGVSTANVNYLKQFITAPSASGKMCVNCPKVQATDSKGNLYWKDVPNVEVGDINILPPSYSNTKRLTSSVDYNLSDKDQIRTRYIFNKQATVDTSAVLPQFFTPLLFPSHLIALSEYHTFSSNISNEARIGYTRTEGRWTAPGGNLAKLGNLDMFPNVSIDDIGMNLGPDPNAPQYNIQNTYQLVDNVTWVKGNHTLKIGGEVRKAISPQLFVQRYRGDYEWATLEGYVNDVATGTFADKNASLYPGLGARDGLVFAERSNGGVGYSGDNYGLFGFVNDQWKYNDHLTLNLGLRYEYTSVPYGMTQQKLNSIADAPGLITFGSPKAPTKNFMPRIGFAYSPGKSGNTSFRGGFGMGYDVMYDNIGTLARPPQIGSTIDCPGSDNCPTSAFLANGGIKPGAGNGISVLDQATARAYTASYLPNNMQYPYAINWNLGVQHVFATNYTAEVRYVGTRGVHLDVQTRLNAQSVVTPTHNLPTYTTAPSQATLDALPLTLAQLTSEFNNGGFIVPEYLNAGFESMVVGFMPYGSSVYHALQSQLNRRFANGLQFQAAYTWSHNIDNSTADFFSTVLTPRRPQDFQNWAGDRSNSALDRRHRFSISAIYDAPWFKNSNNWFLKNIAGNFQFAPIYTFESGEWADVQSGVDSNMNGDNAGDRFIVNPSGNRSLSSGVTALKNSAGDTVGYLATDANAYYIKAGAGALANGGRNTLKMNPINNFDMTATKRLSFTERYKFEFSAQMLNVLNHPQWIANSINDILSNGLATTAERNFLIPGNANFNQASKVFPSNARTVQLSAKFIF
jgi:hypothetical protein